MDHLLLLTLLELIYAYFKNIVSLIIIIYITIHLKNGVTDTKDNEDSFIMGCSENIYKSPKAKFSSIKTNIRIPVPIKYPLLYSFLLILNVSIVIKLEKNTDIDKKSKL